jgi:copper homeostasis protein
VQVLIRHRAGDFVYSKDELQVMRCDIENIYNTFENQVGVVVGALTSNNELNVDALNCLFNFKGAENIQKTFHKAIDVVKDPIVTLKMLSELEFARVLTSGGASNPMENIAMINAMTELQNRPEVMIGGGVSIEAIAELVQLTLPDAIHLSAKSLVKGYATGPGGGNAEYFATDAKKVAQAACEIASLGLQQKEKEYK